MGFSNSSAQGQAPSGGKDISNTSKDSSAHRPSFFDNLLGAFESRHPVTGALINGATGYQYPNVVLPPMNVPIFDSTSQSDPTQVIAMNAKPSQRSGLAMIAKLLGL